MYRDIPHEYLNRIANRARTEHRKGAVRMYEDHRNRDENDANARHVVERAKIRGAGAYITDEIKQGFKNDVRWTASECVGKALAIVMDDVGMFRTCVNCDHWQDDKQLCSMWNSLPPAKVIVVGCDKHTDLIPFD